MRPCQTRRPARHHHRSSYLRGASPFYHPIHGHVGHIRFMAGWAGAASSSFPGLQASSQGRAKIRPRQRARIHSREAPMLLAFPRATMSRSPPGRARWARPRRGFRLSSSLSLGNITDCRRNRRACRSAAGVHKPPPWDTPWRPAVERCSVITTGEELRKPEGSQLPDSLTSTDPSVLIENLSCLNRSSWTGRRAPTPAQRDFHLFRLQAGLGDSSP